LRQQPKVPAAISVHCVERQGLRRYLPSPGYGHIEPVQLWDEQACSSPRAGSQVADDLEEIGLSASIDTGEAFPSGYVDSILRGIEKDIVRITGSVEFGDRRAGVCIENKHLGRASAANEEAPMLFVERHRKVAGVWKAPPSYDSALLAIDHHYLAFAWHVHEDSRSFHLELERLRVATEGDLGDDFSALRAERGERTRPAFPFAYPEKVGTALVSDVIWVRAQPYPSRPFEVAAFEDGDTGSLAVGHEQLLLRWEKGNALRFSEPVDTRNMPILLEVDHLQAAALECRHEQAALPQVDGQVIEPARDARQLNLGNFARQKTRLRARGLREQTSTPESKESDGSENPYAQRISCKFRDDANLPPAAKQRN
jgi:hypothetical protein